MDFLCVLGIMVEIFILIEEEKKRIRYMVIECVNGCILIFLGVGGNNMFIVVEILKNEDFIGVDVIFLVVFYYNKFF